MQVLVGLPRDAAATGRAGQEAQLHQVRLVHILQRNGLLADGGGQCVQPHRAAAVVFDDGAEHTAVHIVQAQGIHLQRQQRLVGHVLGDDAVGHHLGKVADTAQHTVGDAGRAAGAPGDLHSAAGLDGNVQNTGAARDDLPQLLGGIQLQPERDAEAVAQRRGQRTGPGGRADEGKFGQVQADGVGGRAFADDNVDGVVLHGGVQYLLHRPVQAVYLIHEQDVVLAFPWS